jgi:RNA recognition motif-containing protein
MGRYTNVQSYADNSPSMRTISYEQATGLVATSPASPSLGASEGQRPTPSPPRGDGDGRAEEASAVGAKSSQLKSDGDAAGEESLRNQAHPRGTVSSAVSCDTSTLFVGGLHPRIGDLHLRKLFSPYGEIVRIYIVTHNPSDPKHNSIVQSKAAIPAKCTTGLQQSKGYAFVEFNSIESARLAISRLDRRQLMGRSLAVRPSRKRTSELARSGFSGGETGKSGGGTVSVDDARREYTVVQTKIEALKRAIEEKKKGL